MTKPTTYDAILDEEREEDINFSFNTVVVPLIVPTNQQMIVHQQITLEADLILKGDLVLIN